TISELLLDGARMRLELDDPRALPVTDEPARQTAMTRITQQVVELTRRLARRLARLEGQGAQASAEGLGTSPASRHKGGRTLSARGQAILCLLGEHPDGLTNAQIKVSLGIDSKTPIHDLLDGMVKRGKLRKDTTGPELKYFTQDAGGR